LASLALGAPRSTIDHDDAGGLHETASLEGVPEDRVPLLLIGSLLAGRIHAPLGLDLSGDEETLALIVQVAGPLVDLVALEAEVRTLVEPRLRAIPEHTLNGMAAVLEAGMAIELTPETFH
jgi:hypothetical protein